MPLHLVGETIDKTRSHYLAETGRLVQLMRGVYVDAGDDIDATVIRHAVPIAHYLYPRAISRRRAPHWSVPRVTDDCSSAADASSGPACARSRSFRT
jgi:hypothetical protein